MVQIPGIHHVTAIAGDPQRNLDFYTGPLGLRLVKLTVNFDDPGTYHLYFADARARPGTILTFFPWSGAPRARHGTGQTAATAFAIPGASLPYWSERLAPYLSGPPEPVERFGERVLSFEDPDGMRLELIAGPAGGAGAARDTRASAGATESPVPPEHALRGFHSVTLALEGYERTARLLTDTFGFEAAGAEGNRFRFRARSDQPGRIIDLLCTPDGAPGRLGVGAVHHVAWRAPTPDDQLAWREAIARLGFNVTPVVDRTYFQSTYFREPGHVLFEIATDPPGLATDEDLKSLGTRLMLPPHLEHHRHRLEQSLPKLKLPGPR